MVDFTLTDEQKALREMAHDFAEKEIRSVAWELDVDGTWPQEIINKAWELGLMNSHIPEEYGGVGASYLDGCLIEEELAWGCSGVQTSVGANGLAAAPVLLAGSDETKKKYLGMLTERPALASFCLTEPNAGSDVSGMRTLAVRKAAYSKLQAALVANPPMLPLFFQDDLVVLKSRIVGPVIRSLGDLSDRYWDVLAWRLADVR